MVKNNRDIQAARHFCSALKSKRVEQFSLLHSGTSTTYIVVI